MFTFIYELRFWYCDLIFIFALEWTANFSPSIFPSFSDSSSRKTLEFIYTGWRRWGEGRVYLVCWKNQEFHSYSWLLLSSFTCPFPSFENSQESSSFYWHIIFISFLSNCVPLHHFEKCWLRICYWNLCLDFSSRQFHICSFENEFSGFPAYFWKKKNRFVFSSQKLVYG